MDCQISSGMKFLEVVYIKPEELIFASAWIQSGLALKPFLCIL